MASTVALDRGQNRHQGAGACRGQCRRWVGLGGGRGWFNAWISPESGR